MAAKNEEPQTAAENPKVVVPTSAKIPDSMKSSAPQPSHPSTGAPDPVSGDKAIDDAKARAAADFDEDLDIDDSVPTNIPPPVGNPIKCIVRKKFYGEDEKIHVAGELYYFQPRKGQKFPAEVLEPVDKNLAKKYRAEWRDYRQERADERARKEAVRSELRLAGGL